MQLSFGEFVLDLDQRRLFSGDREIRLTPKSFELLKVLVDNRPRALAKDDLVARLWPDAFVGDNNLATLVSDLRGALNDQAQHARFIRTVYGYGYAFAGEAREQHPCTSSSREQPSGWTLLYDDRAIPLRWGGNVLGRRGPGVLVLDSPTVSRHHARLSIADERATVEDLGSKNGTWLGSTQVRGAVLVRDGDRLRLGSVLVVVRFMPRVVSTETVAGANL